jgi:hypothetical protein
MTIAKHGRQFFAWSPTFSGQSTHFWPLLMVACLPLLTACAHRQLAKNTALTATTINTIYYRMVLDNVAMMSCHPEALPAHLRLGDGTVQISNQLSFGEAGGFSTLDHTRFGFQQWGPGGSTQVSEQWGTDAVRDPIQVVALQTIYRKALGMAPLPQPNFIREAQEAAAQNNQNGNSNESSSESPSDLDDNLNGGPNGSIFRAPQTMLASTGNGERNGKSNNGGEQQLEAADFDIPTGWFHIGERKDVPKNACYVGSFKDRYAWVDARGMDGLARFTLAVLTVIKADSGETVGRGGLMVKP